jgi:hypothetical protein
MDFQDNYNPNFISFGGWIINGRFWISYPEISENAWAIREGLGQIMTEIKIALPVSHNTFKRTQEYIQWTS